jgi:hypothetical protein
VRVRAVIGGNPRWQMREILAGTSYGGHNALEAHFGLGDATVADTVRVEWPGGGVDQLTNVAADARVIVTQGQATLDAPRSGPSSGLGLALSPNPGRGAITAHLSLAAAGPVVLEVFDTTGRAVLPARHERLSPGTHTWVLSDRALAAAGVYLVRLRAGSQSVTRRFVRLR